MAWPDNISNITSNMNESELWVLKEQLDHGDWEMDHLQAFAEYGSWHVHVNGLVYEVTEFSECICSIHRL